MQETVAIPMRFALDVAFKATVLLSLTGLAVLALKRSSASIRHLVATLGLAGLLILPFATLVAPSWEIPLVPNPVPERATAPESVVPARFAEFPEGADSQDVVLEAAATDSSEVRRPVSAPAGPAPSRSPIRLSPTAAMLAILAIWSAGALFGLARLLLGARRVARITRLASAEADESWTRLLDSISQTLGLERPVGLLFSGELAVPVTTGLLRPVVLLPEGAHRWNDERRRVVLLHELAHVKRGDWLALLLGEAAARVFWFHPLAWTALIGMRKDCERACDDLVLAAGTRASAYAAHLLSIIRSLRLSGQRAMPAVAMARRSYWDGRMRAILDPGVARSVVSRSQAGLALSALVAAVVALAALQPWASAQAEAACGAEKSGIQPAVHEKSRAKEYPKTVARIANAGTAAESETHVTAASETDDESVVIAEAEGGSAGEGYVTAAGKKRRSGDSWYSRGMELHNDERFDEAIDAFQKSIEEGERIEAATYNIACGYARKGDVNRAFEWLDKAIGEGFDVHSYLAKDDDLDSLRSDPRFAKLRNAAREGKMQASSVRAGRLAEKYDRLKASSATRGGSYYEIGKELLEVGRYDLAAEAFQASAARGYKDGASLYNTACALSLKGDRARALDYLHRSLEAGFDDPRLIRKDEDLDNVRGEPRYRELLEMADDLELHRFDDWGGKTWLRSSRNAAWREVEQHFDAYTRSHPQSGRAWFNLGYARIEGDRPAEAVEAFRRALDIGYRKPTTMYNLACAYSLLDRRDEAFQWLSRALDAGFDASGLLRSDDDLDNLRGDARFRQALNRVKDLDHDDDD